MVFFLWSTQYLVGDMGLALALICFWPACAYIPMIYRGTLIIEFFHKNYSEKVENKKKKKKKNNPKVRTVQRKQINNVPNPKKK